MNTQNTIDKLLEEYETPLYITDLEQVANRYNKLQNALPFCTVKYASKANFDPQVLRTIVQQDGEIVSGSSQEATVAYKSGCEPENLQVTAVSPKDSSITQLVKFSKLDDSFTTTINDVQTAERLIENGYVGNMLLRLQPSEELRSSSKYKNGSHLKFGLTEKEIQLLLPLIDDSEATINGFHCHLGGSFMMDNLELYCEHIKYTIEEATKYVNLQNIDVLNFGGGFGIPYKPTDEPLNLSQVSKQLKSVLPMEEDIEFVIEPGRYVVGPTTKLFTEVKTIRDRGDNRERFVGVDAGMDLFSRPTMFDVYHHIDVYKNTNRETIKQTVAGPTCSGADIFCNNREFTRADLGDVLEIHDVGAYGFVMSTNFHAYSSPTIVTLDGTESPSMEEITDLAESF